MGLTPNLSGGMRVLFVAFGIALGATPFVLELGGVWRWLLPLLGAATVLEGAVGW